MTADHPDTDRASLRALIRETEPLLARIRELELRLAERERRVAELETAAELSALEPRSRPE